MLARDAAVKERDGKSGADARGSSHPSTKAAERQVASQQPYASDPKYKKYTQQVEKCLNAFDNVHEWADCIAFLKQLLKTFQSYLQFKEIPHKLIVAKRLAQCLNPALPAGVHQRALDVYTHILSVLGTEGLKRDLPLWSSGLFPFFEYASTSVKPTLLNIYDTYYLPLQHDLRPVMKSFILALLPGLEEETGEFFDKVLGLLDRLADTVSPVFFMQNMWLVMITMPPARGSALNFLLRRLPALHSEDVDITHVVGRDIGLMIRAFSAVLEDDNLLVRRGALDILLQSMRMDSATLKSTQPEDRAILMKAATSVVLRRDLSLNRRLYTWLLGPDDKSDAQTAYLRQHGLQLLSSTLKNEMFTPSEEYAESRPFKIFISLLDKWEIGSPLTEVLIYDALKAIHQHMQSKSDTSDDVAMTASTLLEAVEPSILWRQLFRSILHSIDDGKRLEAIHLTLFLLRELQVHDDEVRSVHLPIVFAALVEKLLTHIQENNSRVASLAVRETCILQQEVLRNVVPEALQERPKLSDTALQESSTSFSPLVFATTFYDLDPPTILNYRPAAPITTAVEQLLTVCQTCAKCMVQTQGSGADLIATFSQLLSTLTWLVELSNVSPDASPDASQMPSGWLEDMLDCLDMESVGFPLLDHSISLIIALHRSSRLLPNAPIKQKLVVSRMVKRLFRFLRHDCAIYHVRAVDLVWTLESSTGHRYVESIIAQSLNSPNLCSLEEAFEAFGVLWRLTVEDEVSPGFRLKVPMMIVLDTLRHDQPSIRRAGETWMRCNLRSYARVLEPIVYDLIDPTIRRKPCRTKIKGKEVQGYIYEQAFDQRYVHHLLEVLLAIVQFGGQGFVKTARSYPINRSNHKPLTHRLAAGSIDSTANFLDVLVEVLSRFLQSEPKEQQETTMGPLNIKIQSASVDLLHAIVARGEIDYISLEVLEPVVIGKLYFTVHLRRLDLQNKLLRILHSLISAHIAQSSVLHSEGGSSEAGPRTYTMNPLLTQTLIDGISLPHNRVMLQHWLDFVLMAIQQFQSALQGAISPIVDCLCRQLRAFLADVLLASQPDSSILGVATDAEFIMLLNAVERLLILGLASQAELSQQDEDSPSQEKSATESSGILGLVSNVFTVDNASTQPDDHLPRSPGYRSLHEGIRALFAIWINLVWTAPSSRRSKDDSLSIIYSRTRARCRRALEHLSRAHPNEVLESLVICWDRDLTLHSRDPKQAEDATFELVDTLIASAHSAVHMVCESVGARTPGLAGGSRKYINSILSDSTLLKFLEQYLSRLEGPLALQVWGRFIQLAKDVNSNVREFRAQTYLVLRCLCVLGEKVTQTTAMEDKRIKKDLQEVFAKLLDACVTFAGRSSESGSWIRRTTRESIMNGRSSPMPRGVSDQKVEDNANSSTASLPDNVKPTLGNELSLQITNFVATTVLPNLRKFLPDNDKVASACSNIVYYVVNPAVKGKSRPLDLNPVVVEIIKEMTKISAALKVWRAPVIDILYDNRVFNSNTAAATRWKPVVKALFDSDKTSFGDLLSRIASAPSANIFSNRENEMLVRSLNLRRLSFVLFTGEKNHFLTQLPSVQEKLVDILRNVPSAIVQSEVYLCIRVLLCRLSPHNLTSFWPVILTELYRIFEQIIVTVPADESEELPLILSASKCLDLLLTLQTEEFQIHQWIFVTDTVDAIYRPDNWTPHAMFDQLAETITSLPVPETKEHSKANGGVTFPTSSTSISFPSAGQSVKMRRPMLDNLRQIDSIRDLMPFFSHVSISSYESVYACAGNIDWEAVEQGILDDMFDSR
ncbi:Dopey, N-terminal-domain-containing protein [Pisolithus tinctorius]|nr:Dopey, N-terminal-domain-containing protein [Pisolithus tinctorius]